MGNKTVKRVGILLGIAVLLGGTSFALWRFQVERMAQSVVAQAEKAEAEGDYARAVELYREHLTVMPSDVEVKLKYADVLTKPDWGARQPELALEIYEGLVREFPGREDVRRRAAEVAAELATKSGGNLFERARGHLAILLKTAKDDGHLEFLMGRCYEEDKEYASAADAYRSAIAHGAPERIEAARRRAMLLDTLGRTDEADQVINAMVESAPDDYRVYLERGRYRNRPDPPGRGDGVRRALKMAPGLGLGWLAFYLGGGDDFRKALQLAPQRPEVYREVAGAAERESGYDAARQVLDNGLAAAPGAVDLYGDLASLELRAGHVDQAIDALKQGLKSMPDQYVLHAQLAQILAEHGGAARSGELRLQINELERLGTGRQYTQYLTACLHFNRHEYVQAKRILTPLQPDVAASPPLKAAVNVLLSRCCAVLGEPEMAREAMLRAYSASPESGAARLGWIQGLIERGQIDEAIREYQGLLTAEPRVRIPLAALLIERNRRLPGPQRQWGDVERLIAEAAAVAAPGDDRPELLRAQMLVEQDQKARAIDALETARVRFPRSVELWIRQAEILAQQKEFLAARALLEQARQKVGDQVDLRLAVRTARDGRERSPRRLDPQRPGRGHRGLLAGGPPQAAHRAGHRPGRRELDLAGAARAWSRLAEEEPESLQPRLQLLELRSNPATRSRPRGRSARSKSWTSSSPSSAGPVTWSGRRRTPATPRPRRSCGPRLVAC